jgi:hypothetical protein
MKGSICDEEHDLLEPSFRRPDAYLAVPEEHRPTQTRAMDWLASIRAPQA